MKRPVYYYLSDLSYMFRQTLHQPLEELSSLALHYLLTVMLLHWVERSRRDLIINNTYVQLYVCI
jgi:hypothetical protein